MNTPYADVAQYTDPTSGQLVGGSYGFFIKAPITPALASYIEGRMNDDSSESKRIELYRVPLADNQSNVIFRFVQAGTSSWFWAIDNWGIYSDPSQVIPGVAATLGPLDITKNSDESVTIQWTVEPCSPHPLAPVLLPPTTKQEKRSGSKHPVRGQSLIGEGRADAVGLKAELARELFTPRAAAGFPA